VEVDVLGTVSARRICGGKTMWISTEVNDWMLNLPVRRLKHDRQEEGKNETGVS
jgi:hypothetical protein